MNSEDGGLRVRLVTVDQRKRLEAEEGERELGDKLVDRCGDTLWFIHSKTRLLLVITLSILIGYKTPNTRLSLVFGQ